MPACVDRLVPSGRGGRRLTSCHSDLCFTRTALMDDCWQELIVSTSPLPRLP